MSSRFRFEDGNRVRLPVRCRTRGEKMVLAGIAENKTRPNVCDVGVNSHLRTSHLAICIGLGDDTIAVLETNLDDINAEVLGHFVERALAAGALDIFHTPIQMKKSRRAFCSRCCAPKGITDRFSEMMLRETSAFGVRRTLAERRKLRREFATARTRFGKVTMKLGTLDGESCACRA